MRRNPYLPSRDWKPPKPAASILLSAHLCEVSHGFNVVAEYPFHRTRKWRFDFAIPPLKIAAELDGGIWIKGRHTTGKGYQADLDKMNHAAALGWLVFRFSTADVLQGRDLDILKMWLRECAA